MDVKWMTIDMLQASFSELGYAEHYIYMSVNGIG